MKAVLITIGDEILSGSTVDTNSGFIAGQLKKIGIPVQEILTVQDEIATIKEALKNAFQKADLVITTGGLGPTKDDKTKTAFCEYFNDKIVLHPATYRHLEELMTRRNRAHLLDLNKSQAEVLSTAFIFQNEYGTAPCQMIRQNGKTAICLPGVPFEVKPLIKVKIIPYLTEELQLNHIVTRCVSVVGIPESLLSDIIESWEMAVPEGVSLSYLPVGNRIKLRLTAQGKDRDFLEGILSSEIEKLKPLIGESVISWDGEKIEVILKELLIRKNLTVSTAESFTGGGLSRLLTSVPGSSAYFKGGLVAYDSAVKSGVLNVSDSAIQHHTVVSAEVAEEMCEGAQKMFSTDISLSTTGAAGPDTDDFQTPVGTVFYTIRVKDFVQTNRLFLPHFERNDLVQFTCQRILQDLTEILVKNTF